MSYDLTFVPKDGAPVGARPDAAVWAALVAEAERVLGPVTPFEGEDFCEITDESTGIQLSYYGGEAGITVPYWYSGAAATAIVTKVYELGRSVERLTGFTGYDPQLDLPLAKAATKVRKAVASFDQIAAMFARREKAERRAEERARRRNDPPRPDPLG